MVGLLVFIGWATLIVSKKRYRINRIFYIQFLVALLLSLGLAGSWFGYILSVYPLEASYELIQYQKNFNEVIEGHHGTIWFHFQQIGTLYSPLLLFSLPFCVISLLLYIPRALRLAYMCMVGFVYIFFSLAETKLAHYCIIAAPILYLSWACALHWLEQLSKPLFFSPRFGSVLFSFVLITTSGFLFKHKLWFPNHSQNTMSYQAATIENNCYRQLSSQLPPHPKWVVCNVPHPVKCMFYTRIPAYTELFSYSTIQNLQKNGYRIAIFNASKLSQAYLSDTSIYKVYCNNAPS